MAEGKGTPTPQQEKEPDKRPPWWKRLWEWTEFGKKSGWNWLELLSALAIPVVLAVAGLYFEAQLDERQRKSDARRAQTEHQLEERRADDAALQAYLDQIGTLMLNKNLLESEPGDSAYTLAQARTSTVILRLDAEHNQSVTGFLSDSGLAERSKASARLLRGIALPHAKLSGATLDYADLSDAYLPNADLSGANLLWADLKSSNLGDTDLSNAYLPNADLSDASLDGADLSGAGLNVVDLSDAGLRGADLSGADLNTADLSDANLWRANLSGAKGITDEELELQAASLEGATMPNGQKYEDWLKSKNQENKKSDGSP